MNPISRPRVTEAATFAMQVYRMQRNKNFAERYAEHASKVTWLLVESGASEDVLIAGWLCKALGRDCTDAEICVRFGESVLQYVLAVTTLRNDLFLEELRLKREPCGASLRQDELLLQTADTIICISNLNHTIDFGPTYVAQGCEMIVPRFEGIVAFLQKESPSNRLLPQLTQALNGFRRRVSGC